MIETLIIADDLSGAADCAIACTRAGAGTMVLINADADPGDATAVSIDVNSRAMAPQEAGASAAEAVERFYRQETAALYQKMDSTLRGNWALEMVHIRQAAGKILGRAPLAIVVPAYPEMGRTTIDGHAFVRGVPLEDHEVWTQAGLREPADLRAFLTRVGLKAELVPLEEVALGPDALKDRFTKWMVAGCEAIVCDAQTMEDLDSIAAASLMLSEKPLWVGSAGLMRALVMAEKQPFKMVQAPMPIKVVKPILVVVGSASGASHEQFDALADMQDVASLVIPVPALREGNDSSRMQDLGRDLDRALALGMDVAVAIGSEEINLQEGGQLASILATFIAPRLPRVGGLVATGGETARALLVRAGISGLRMQGIVEPGVPIGLAAGAAEFPVITKAGAFGDRRTLIRCRDALRGGYLDGAGSPRDA